MGNRIKALEKSERDKIRVKLKKKTLQMKKQQKK